jgi:hypothetical protein
MPTPPPIELFAPCTIRPSAGFSAELPIKKVPLSLPFASLSSCFRFSV